MEGHGSCSNLQACMKAMKRKVTTHPLPQSNISTKKYIIKGKLVIVQNQGHSGPGKSAFVRIYSSTVIDPSTGKGKLSEKAYLKHGKSKKQDHTKKTTFKIKLQVEPEFGIPGAFLISNKHKHEFFLESATLEFLENQIVHFDCRSWAYPVQKTKSDRLFFSNTSYLPNQTPGALVDLRKSELASLRGDGAGEMKEWDRVYDYDYYNDLGCPDKGQKHIRPVLGGSKLHPYPRRGRTGRPPCSTDPLTESQAEIINLDVHVPPEERFSPKKLSEFISNSVQAAAHFLIPEAESLFKPGSSTFKSFDEIYKLFAKKRNQAVQGKVRDKLKKSVPEELFKKFIDASKEETLKFPLPEIITENKSAWKDDEEFGRQMLAGTNPARIQCLQVPPTFRDFVEYDSLN